MIRVRITIWVLGDRETILLFPICENLQEWRPRSGVSGVIELPLSFVEREGEPDGRVKYVGRGLGHGVFFTREGVFFTLSGQQSGISAPGVVELRPLGMNKGVRISGQGAEAGKINYFLGSNPEHWKAGLTAYRSVLYEEAYPGIDLRFYGNLRQIEYDVVVKKGADLSRVRLEYRGVEALAVDDGGDLVVRLRGGGTLTQKRPVVYQVIDGERKDLSGKFKISKRTQSSKGRASIGDKHRGGKDSEGLTYGFEVASYQRRYPLIIDPTLVFSTYFGGAERDYANGIALDAQGNIYVAGETEAPDICEVIPCQDGPITEYKNNVDAFLAKLDGSGSNVVYLSYLGGSKADRANAIAVDQDGGAYLTGLTYSTDFPTTNAVSDKNSGSYDAFVSKFNGNGHLEFSTYLGGDDGDVGSAIALDRRGNIWVAGGTHSSRGFPMTDAIQDEQAGQADAFVAELNPQGSAVLFCSYLGGSGWDQAFGITSDDRNNIYLTGITYSADFPTQQAFQASYGGGQGDAFIVKISGLIPSVVYSTYLGGGGHDSGLDIAVDQSENVYVVGDTNSAGDFPVSQNGRARCDDNRTYGGGDYGGGGMDAFLAKIDTKTTGLPLYASFFGGSGADYGVAVALAKNGLILVGGESASSDFPICKPFRYENAPLPYQGLGDAFVLALRLSDSPSGASMFYSAYLGGTDWEWASDLALDENGTVYVTGVTSSPPSSFPLLNALRDFSAYEDASNGFVAKIKLAHTYFVTSEVEGGHGEIVPSKKTEVEEGRDLVIKVKPKECYHLADLLLDNHSVVQEVDNNTLKLTNIIEDHEIVAKFEINSCTIDLQPDEHCQLLVDGIPVSGAYMLNCYEGQQFTIQPDDHYHVQKIRLNEDDQDVKPKITMSCKPTSPSKSVLQIVSELDEFTIRAEISPSYPGGSIQPAGPVEVEFDGKATFSLKPDPGYCLRDLLLDGKSVLTDVEGNHCSEAHYTIRHVAANQVLRAQFNRAQYCIEASKKGCGAIKPAGKICKNPGSSPQFKVSPNDGCHIERVLVDKVNEEPPSHNDPYRHRFPDLDGNHTIEASFAANPCISLNCGQHGSINRVGSDVSCPKSVCVEYEAKPQFHIYPNQGYYTDHIRISGRELPLPAPSCSHYDCYYTFDEVTEPQRLEATFVRNPCIRVICGDHGKVERAGSNVCSESVCVIYEQTPQFHIMPDAGYRIKMVKVDGISVGDNAWYTFPPVTSDQTLEATFEVKAASRESLTDMPVIDQQQFLFSDGKEHRTSSIRGFHGSPARS